MSEAQRDLLEMLPELEAILRASDFASVKEVEAGEEGVALATICSQLHEYEIRIPRAMYDKLRSVGNKMSMAAKTWEILQPLVDG